MQSGGSATVHIDASPEAVYDLIADIERMPEWSPETYRAHWVGGATAAAAGARFRGWNRMGPVRWCTDPVIDAAERGRVLQFTTTFFGRGRLTTWRYELSASNGGTDLTESWEERSSLMARLLPSARADQIQRGIEQTLERIKAAAERQSSAQ
jgi:uncharacterized protein YndB with AHSA1/START domain